VLNIVCRGGGEAVVCLHGEETVCDCVKSSSIFDCILMFDYDVYLFLDVFRA
jgi:hypothetical protein